MIDTSHNLLRDIIMSRRPHIYLDVRITNTYETSSNDVITVRFFYKRDVDGVDTWTIWTTDMFVSLSDVRDHKITVVCI